MWNDRKDEAYKLGVRDGQRGGFLDDFTHSLSKGINTSESDKVYDEGYVYGANHRYDVRSFGKSDNSKSAWGSTESDNSDFQSSYSDGNSYDGWSSDSGGSSKSSGGSGFFSFVVRTCITIALLGAFMKACNENFGGDNRGSIVNTYGRGNRGGTGNPVPGYTPSHYPVPVVQHTRRSNKKYKVKAIYEVRPGDTMWEIAKTFGVPISALLEVNNISRGSRIYVDQKLRIPLMAHSLNEQNEINRGLEVVIASTPNKNIQTTYKVRRGDTLYDIARRFGTTPTNLLEINGLHRNSRIHIGQELNVTGQDEGGRRKSLVNKVTEFQKSDSNQSSIPEIVIPEKEFQKLQNDIREMKEQVVRDKIDALNEIGEAYKAHQISEKEKNEYVKLVTNYNPIIDNFRTKVVGFEMFQKRQKDKLIELIYSDEINSDSIRVASDF